MEVLHAHIEGGDFARAGKASSDIKRQFKKMGIPSAMIRRFVVAVYEAEVNIVAHAYRGEITLTLEPNYVEVILKDEGPGIPDIDQAMQKGFSTASEEVRSMGFGAGMGLYNIKRNSDLMCIDSEVDKGTTVTIRLNL